jgi:hypothetical protein
VNASGVEAKRQKHNLLDAVMFLRGLAQGRQTWHWQLGKATGYIYFSICFFQLRTHFAMMLCVGQGLFNIMANYRAALACASALCGCTIISIMLI